MNKRDRNRESDEYGWSEEFTAEVRAKGLVRATQDRTKRRREAMRAAYEAGIEGLVDRAVYLAQLDDEIERTK